MDQKSRLPDNIAAEVSAKLRSRRKFFTALVGAAGAAAGVALLGSRKLKADSCDGNFLCDQNYHCTPPINCKGFTQVCTPPYKANGEEEEEVAQ